MLRFSRADNSPLARWWWTVDHLLLGSLFCLMAVGTFLVAAASPAVAMRLDIQWFHFIQQHAFVQLVGLVMMIIISMLNAKQVRMMALAAFGGVLILLIATLFAGVEIKGARRWIHLPGLSLQASELLKPVLAVVSAWLFSRANSHAHFPGFALATLFYLISAALLLLQPDLGMTVLITLVWGVQLFLAGIPLLLLAGLAIMAVCGLVGAYFVFPHVTSRFDRFMDPAAGDTYQIEKSIEAFKHGGLFGTGPGQGEVKFYLPDAHADFIFAVAGEELGLIWTLFIVALFAFIVVRIYLRAIGEKDLFTLLALSGLATQFGLQALLHMASSLHLMPTKGMTLPFLSYGGSSILGVSLGMGMVLALSRRSRSHQNKWGSP